MTSSYSSTRLRIRKFCSSTFFWALSIRLHLLLHLGEDLVPGLVPLGRVRSDTPLDELGLGDVLLVAAELDVHAAAGHVGGDRDCAGPAGLGDDLALPL